MTIPCAGCGRNARARLCSAGQLSLDRTLLKRFAVTTLLLQNPVEQVSLPPCHLSRCVAVEGFPVRIWRERESPANSEQAREQRRGALLGGAVACKGHDFTRLRRFEYFDHAARFVEHGQ